jgi:hypothetical protein
MAVKVCLPTSAAPNPFRYKSKDPRNNAYETLFGPPSSPTPKAIAPFRDSGPSSIYLQVAAKHLASAGRFFAVVNHKVPSDERAALFFHQRA